MGARDQAGSAGGAPDESGGIDVLDTLRDMWIERDPVPPDLASRICFALELENLEVELAMLGEELGLAGARGEEQARTVTFTSASLSVMVTLSEPVAGAVRVDGWIAGGAGLLVTLRLRDSAGPDPAERDTTADEDGRFAFDEVPTGMVQFVFRSPPIERATDQTTEPDAVQLSRPVVTPSIAL